ncbi:uncharacterized protein HD556DRAFT_1437159 [Suillus plorans]|uniref:Uncharacterized protein n=1 Tax=Suillus plorans TaxID=116603 RepID=A0A9P7J6C7_9AGAM|nr:uncharacterized protein HD556DRAFT_1437159 [Suillus plorans]KAG1805002.1 hypothetical protein HD556DRAFT_1437159 [Suillus plorans]
MKFSATYLALFVASTLAQFTINTPANVVECQPTLLQWSGGTAPYFLVGDVLLTWLSGIDPQRILFCYLLHRGNNFVSILPGATPNGAAVENLGQQNSTSVTWVCNVQSGTSLGLTLRDSTGLTAQSAPFTVNPGWFNFGAASTTCTNTTSLSSGPTVATSAAAPTGTTPATSGAVSGTGTTAHTTSATTAAGSASTSSSAASANVIRVGAAGIAGAAAVAALLF